MASFESPLVAQTEVRLHFKITETCRVKCCPQNNAEEVKDGDTSNIEVQFVDLLSSDPVFRSQPKYGALLDQRSYGTYRLRTNDLSTLSITVTQYTHDPNAGPDGPHPVIGSAQILPTMLGGGVSTGTLSLEIKGGNGKTNGQLTAEYVVICPTASLTPPSAPTSLSWDGTQGPLDMGHRGMGKCRSRKTAPYVLENTIKCFKMSADHGADFIEFDVQVTKDNQIVVFHDFLCRVQQTNTENGSSSETTQSYRDAPVTDFTYDELRNLKATFVGTEPADDADAEETLFPLLREAFDKIHPEMGFNVEIKFPSQLKSGDPEDGLATFRDMNEYLDLILTEIQKYGGDRKIHISCFNPDVCVMLRQKQAQFPVLFLTQGEVERYAAFMDRRTRDVPIAISLATAERLAGVNPISEYILQDFSLVQRAVSQGLSVMCWGAENNDPEVIQALKQNGVHIVIYDRLNEFIDSSKARNKTS